MITITSAQWYAWIAAFFWPFLRVLGLILAEPVLGNRAVPVQVKRPYWAVWLTNELTGAVTSEVTA